MTASFIPATAGLLAAVSAGVAVVMIRAVAAGRSRGPRPRALALATGILLASVAGTASGAAALAAPGVLVAEVPLPAEIPLVSLFLAAAAYLPAILRPHQHRDPLARLRAGLDTLGVTACLIFPAWLFLFSDGTRRGASITALIFGGGAAAVVAVAGVHAIRHRAALQWCGPGAALSLIGLTALVVGMDFPSEPNAAIAAVAGAGALTVAAGLLWYGSVRLLPEVRPAPPAGFPLLAVPVLGSALATGYHLINGGSLDAVSIVLGTTVIMAVAGREWTSVLTLRRHADHLTDQGNRLRSLVFGAVDVAMILDADLAVRWQSPAAARQFGLSDQDVLGRAAAALVHPDQVEALHAFLTARMTGDAWTGTDDPAGNAGPDGDAAARPGRESTARPGRESTARPGRESTARPGRESTARPTGDSVAIRLRDGFGRWRETEWTTSGADPAAPGRTLVVHVRDVSRTRDLEEALHQAAHLDQQTSLANRQGLRRAGELVRDPGAVIVVELGGLTAIGDVHGPDHEEVVVVEAARRLRTRAESTDVPARLAENRFAVLTRRGAVRAHLLASQVLNALTAPYEAVGTVSHLSAWAGLADYTADTPIDETIRRATLALRSARSGAPGTVEWYDEEMETRLLRRSTLEQDLPGAVARGELDLRYQPVVELPGGRPAGVEAIPAWRHPTLGPVPAAELLPLAEDLGLLAQVGQWTLDRSCRLLAGWRRQHESLWLAVTVHPAELVAPAFQAALHTALETCELPPSALVVTVTERDLQPAVEDLAAQLGRLRAQGVRTAVGDFGTGPTSLSRLRILPADLLKIDRDVLGQDDAVMEVAVTLARRFGLEVIAQGLRTRDDLDTVQAAGCRLGQGDLLGAPMPAEHLEALLEQHRGSLPRG